MPWIIHPDGRRELVNPTLEEQIAFGPLLQEDRKYAMTGSRPAAGKNGTPARESASARERKGGDTGVPRERR